MVISPPTLNSKSFGEREAPSIPGASSPPTSDATRRSLVASRCSSFRPPATSGSSPATTLGLTGAWSCRPTVRSLGAGPTVRADGGGPTGLLLRPRLPLLLPRRGAASESATRHADLAANPPRRNLEGDRRTILGNHRWA